MLRSLLVGLPNAVEQRCICEGLGAAGRRISVESLVQRRLSDVKAALMSVLLTGEVRVTPDEDAA